MYRAIDEVQLNELALQTGFCKRKRKLIPVHFLEMLLCKTFEANQQSLTDHIYELQSQQNISIRKQSLHNRFTPEAVAFLQKVIGNQLNSFVSFKNNDLLKCFSKIFIQDSTRFGLPEQLEKHYPCFGGNRAKAGAQIQFVYELKGHKIHHVELCEATRNDNVFSTTNDWIEEGSLVLRDMGYFSFKGLQEVINKKAYFISRAKPKTVFYSKSNNEEKLNLKTLINYMNKNNLQYLDKELIMGYETKLPVRVILCKVPEQVKEQRLRNATKNAKTRNWTVTEDFKIWAGVNVFITNIGNDVLSSKTIPLVYRLRWQIELIFKTWKSHYKIHLYKSMKKERIECYLYGTLLLILLHWQLFSWLQYVFSKENKILSIHKFTKVMHYLKLLFTIVVIKQDGNLSQLLQAIYRLAQTALVKESKKGKIGMVDIINCRL